MESVSEESEPVCTFGAVAVQATVVDDFEICGTALVSGTTARSPEIVGTASDEAASASSPSRYETERKCVGYVTVSCLSPPQPAGFVSFDIHSGAVGGASGTDMGLRSDRFPGERTVPHGDVPLPVGASHEREGARSEHGVGFLLQNARRL